MRLSEEADPPPAVTLRDVARLANVHPSTVSRVLNGARRSRVTVDTAQRIQAIAEELGYRPNLIAQGLRTRRSRSIGVLVTDLGNPVIPPIVRGIDERLAEEGYTVLLGNTDHSSERERAHLEAMRAKLVDGVISATATLEPAGSAEGWVALPMPLVFVNRGSEDGRVPAAVPDDRRCAELAVDHLASLGHTRIAHVAGSAATSTGRRRREGFEAALARHGLRSDPALVLASERYTIAEGARCAAALLARGGEGFSAIVAANDLLALGCCDALRAAGLACPADVSVVGCNDMPFADRFEPALTTVHIPHAQLGRAAAGLLLERLEQPALAVREVSVEPHLVVRGSSGPALP